MARVSSKAFTLIELLVVISIISLLIAILLPSLAAARRRAQEIQCASNLRSVQTANLLYAQDNDDLLVPNFATGQASYPAGPAPFGGALLVKLSYTIPQMLYSPADKDRQYGTYGASWNNFKNTGSIVSPYTPIRTSYQFREPNSTSFQMLAVGNSNYWGNAWTPHFRLSDVTLGKMALVADRFIGANYVWSAHENHGRTGSGANTGGANGEGWHVAFADGHIAFYKNENGVYEAGNLSGAGWDWSSRHLNWLYWDKH